MYVKKQRWFTPLLRFLLNCKSKLDPLDGWPSILIVQGLGLELIVQSSFEQSRLLMRIFNLPTLSAYHPIS